LTGFGLNRNAWRRVSVDRCARIFGDRKDAPIFDARYGLRTSSTMTPGSVPFNGACIPVFHRIAIVPLRSKLNNQALAAH
jgi:hypothetical protein